MKIKDVAHNHSLTDLLKVGIFSILMLAPMINVGVRSAYVICNKNAYQSYYGETINEETINNIDTFKIGNTYHFNSNYGNLSYITNNTYYFSNVTNIVTSLTNDLTNLGQLRFLNYNGNLNINLYTTEGMYINSFNANTSTFLEFDATYDGSTNSLYKEYFYYITYNNYSYLDNVFEYSVNKLTESPLYNWVENTAIYSGVALMNTQLGITQPVISLLVVYWLLLTIIYVIIDIVIRVFTWLTHMIGSKTA